MRAICAFTPAVLLDLVCTIKTKKVAKRDYLCAVVHWNWFELETKYEAGITPSIINSMT